MIFCWELMYETRNQENGPWHNCLWNNRGHSFFRTGEFLSNPTQERGSGACRGFELGRVGWQWTEDIVAWMFTSIIVQERWKTNDEYIKYSKKLQKLQWIHSTRYMILDNPGMGGNNPMNYSLHFNKFLTHPLVQTHIYDVIMKVNTETCILNSHISNNRRI
jgi:hypothetical protein